MPPTTPRPGRNEPCHCGSGRKYKQCCLDKDHAADAAARTKAAEAGSHASSDAAVSDKPTRPQKTKSSQPWKAKTTRGFVPRMRTPRKVGGS